jgi:O-acetyl-ADP-ribose deacetylase (regulator of RNase III)
MSIDYNSGDILDWADKVDYIGHQVNCFGVMGGGLALQIANKWPEVLAKYQEFITDFKRFNNGNRKGLLGKCHIVSVGGCFIANLFGQFGTGYGLQTDYKSLSTALVSLRDTMVYTEKKTLALPVNLGCGLAGGNWSIVHSLILEAFEKSPIQVTLVEFAPQVKR